MKSMTQLRQLSREVLVASLALVLVLPVAAQPQVAACDLMDQKMASEVLREDIQQHTPNRDVKVADSVTVSACFFAAANGSIRILLSEYPTPADAIRGVQAITFRSGVAKFSTEKELGDQAYWWSAGEGSHGYVIRRDKRLLYVETRWYDTLQAGEAKQRLSRFIGPMAAKL
jgi:hypothetical protein